MAEPEGFRSERNATPGLDDAARAFFEAEQRRDAAEAGEPEASPQASEEAPDSELEASLTPDGTPEEPAEATDEGEVEEIEAEPGDYFTVKVDGVESQVTLDELQRGYQTAEALGRRGREIAEGRQELEAARAAQSQELAAARQSLATLTQQLQQELAATGPNMQELEQLRATDPAEYSARVLDLQRRATLMQQAQQEQQRAQYEEVMRTVAQEKVKLQDAVPEFAADFEGEFTKLRDFVTSPSGAGVPPEMFNQVHDHRWLALMFDGMRYRQAVQRAPQTRQKVKAKPRIRAAGTPPDPAAASHDRRADALQNMKKRGGSMDSTVAAFLEIERQRG